MKILAIRGKNLTSLAGEFSIDFQVEPLASAGLFAITGPTGAGKSTLLDAVCLALYEETPRLSRKTGRSMEIPDVGKETLTQYDARTILRRGAAEGYAEVDFAGNDGIPYRARWSVRRAGTKASGRLQKTEHSLLRLSDQQRLGSTNSEVRKEIEQRIGLGFEQFTRAVILAQNEFAAFLKADDNQRGELLEALTGTDIYSDISIRAFDRAKQEQAALQQLRARMEDQHPLTAEARETLERQAEQTAIALAELDRSKETLDSHIRWFQEHDRLSTLEKEAVAAHEAALAEQASANELRTLFATLEAVQPARPLLTDYERLCREMTEAESLLAAASAHLEAARAAQEAAAKEQVEWEETAKAAELAYQSAMPDLDRAKALDAEIDMLLPAREEAQSQWEMAQAGSRTTNNELLEKQATHAETGRAKAMVSSWLQNNEHKRILAESWQRYEVFLAEACQGQNRYLCALAALEPAREWERQQGKAYAQCSDKLAFAEQVLRDVTVKREEAATLLARFDAETLLARQKQATRQKELLVEADSLWRDLSAARSRYALLDAEIVQLIKDIAAADTVCQDAAQAISHQQIALNQAERSLQIAAAACSENVERLRDALVPDAPCPVCGATKHPYRTEGRQLHALFAGLETEVTDQRAKLADIVRRHTQHATVAETGRTRLQDLNDRLSALAAEVGTMESAFANHPLVATDASLQAGYLEERLSLVAQELDTLDREEQLWRTASAAAAQAQSDYEAAAEAKATCATAMAQAAGLSTEATIRRQTLEERLDAAVGERDALLSELDTAFPDPSWRQSWHDDPEAFTHQARESAQAWTDNCRRLETLRAADAIESVAKAAAAEAVIVAARIEEEALRTLTQVTNQVKSRQESRRALFDGRPVQDVEKMLQDTWHTARKAVEQRVLLVQQKQHELVRSTEALSNTTTGLHNSRAKLADARCQLDLWLEHASTSGNPVSDLRTLQDLLAWSPEMITEQERQLKAIDHAVHQAAAVLNERSARLLGHEQQRPVAIDADTVFSQRQALEDERLRLQDASTTLLFQLRADDQQRQQAAELAQELMAREDTARTWAQLGELIGSADGKKFRNYAQQFTLDRLLSHANHHLAGISRRYRLERTDMLGVVSIDQEMGDEVRSVHSLSGGESFLISLALALALASLSSNRVQVNSLFIDEGFGSLDSDTLLIAMEALDSLHTLGRKVGVISHVQEMTERIDTQVQIRKGPGGQSHVTVVSTSR